MVHLVTKFVLAAIVRCCWSCKSGTSRVILSWSKYASKVGPPGEVLTTAMPSIFANTPNVVHMRHQEIKSISHCRYFQLTGHCILKLELWIHNGVIVSPAVVLECWFDIYLAEMSTWVLPACETNAVCYRYTMTKSTVILFILGFSILFKLEKAVSWCFHSHSNCESTGGDIVFVHLPTLSMSCFAEVLSRLRGAVHRRRVVPFHIPIDAVPPHRIPARSFRFILQWSALDAFSDSSSEERNWFVPCLLMGKNECCTYQSYFVP